MRKSLNELMTKMESGDSPDEQDFIERVSTEDAIKIKGGDKEYKPLYDETVEKFSWKRSSILLGFLNFK